MTLGQRIRQAREHRKLSRAFVAKRSGVSLAHLKDIELGRCSRIAGTGLLIVYAIAEAMGAPIDEVIPPIRLGCLGRFAVQRRAASADSHNRK